MYQQLYELFVAFMGDIQTFCDNLTTHVTPGYGAPSVEINKSAMTLKSDLESRKGQIPSIQSERIFGE